jgi:hypothetical protein
MIGADSQTVTCPQCDGRGDVPFAASGTIGGFQSGLATATCPTCRGRAISIRQILDRGWPIEALEENHPGITIELAESMLVAEDD